MTEITRETVEHWLALHKRSWLGPGNFYTRIARWALERDAAATIAEARLNAAHEGLASFRRDWEAIAAAAGEKPDIMVTSLRGRILNAFHALDVAKRQLAEARDERDMLATLNTARVRDAARDMGITLPSQEEQQAAIDRETGKRISDNQP